MRRLLIPVLAVTLVIGVAGRAAAQDDPKEVVKKAIAAAGGAEKLDKFKGSKSSSKGSISIMGLDLEFTADSVSQYPDKQKTTIKMDVMGNAVTVVQMVNGDKMSLTVNGMAQQVPDAQKSELKRSVEFQKIMNLTPLLKEGYELKSIPGVKVDGKETIGLQISNKEIQDVKLYFDKTTHLVAKAERKGMDPMGGGDVVQEMIMSDYKDVQGLKKPMKTVMNNDGKKFMESTTTSTELLEKIDDKEFSD